MKNFKKTIIVFIALCQTFMLVSCGKEPIEMVQIPGQNYKMSTTEITQKFYESVMGENPSEFKGENNPVEMVSWYDAIYFCNKLSKKCGYAPVYSVSGTTDVTKWNYTPHQEEEIKGEVTQNTSADGFRLPTVSDWVYAVKGGQNYEYAGSDNIDEVAWYRGNSNDTPHPVAQKKANGYGLYDISGNVWEWCWEAAVSGGYRSIYGGCWCSRADSCTVSSGDNNFAYSRDGGIGFRVVRTVDIFTSLVGCIAYSDGSISEDYDSTKTPIGIVIEVSDEGVATKIVSLTETDAQWSTEYVVTNATSETDGKVNMEAIQAIDGWGREYPAFKWCDNYTDASGNSQWYLPAKDELNQLWAVKSYVNVAIDKIIAGGGTATKLGIGYYWSSSQFNFGDVWNQKFSDGTQGYYGLMDLTDSVRAVRAF